MDLGGWLRSLGLEQYEAAFRDNAIDDTVLPTLTAEDLKDLGVGIVGHRRKLLNAIAALRTDVGAKAPSPDAPPATDITAKDAAERRQVTVLFCDLVGSTALAARWIQRTSARSSAPITVVSRMRSMPSAASLRSTWATACSRTSATRRHMRMMLSVQYALALS